jgi:hypothetical protein
MSEGRERQHEEIPTREMILAEVKRHAENANVTRELSDAEGIFLLETEVKGEQPNETVRYEYQRKGKFLKNKNLTEDIFSPETSIRKTEYADGEAVMSAVIVVYNPALRQWQVPEQ